MRLRRAFSFDPSTPALGINSLTFSPKVNVEMRRSKQ
jgi:hypothetical protein